MGIFGAELVGSDDREAQRRLSTVAATLLFMPGPRFRVPASACGGKQQPKD
jgi:hypothetical protein